MKNHPFIILAAIALILTGSGPLYSATNDTELRGLNSDGITDNTDALQSALGSGNTTVVFPSGVYLIGTVRIPANTTLRAEPGAKIRINPARLTPHDTSVAISRRHNPRTLLALDGDNITLDGLDFDFTLIEADDIPAGQRPGTLISGTNISRIRLLNLTANRPEPAPPLPIAERKARGISGGRYPKPPANKVDFHLSSFTDSTDLLLRDSRARFMQCMINLVRCSGIVVESNRAENCYAITRATQADQYLRHTGNWSREVKHQCRWWGGNANDQRKLKPESAGWGTATTVNRHSPLPGQPGYNPYTFGAFDIVVANNYAEYGQTLSWGSKGRQILFQGNIARFMTDYALGSEGGENVIFNGNLVINSFTAGLVTMYWTEKVVMTGNTVLVRDESMEDGGRYSAYSTPAPYQGGLIRLHAAASPSGSGTGSALITGNLLVNELTNRPRAVSIEAGRDVLFTNNKIRNGSLRVKSGAQRVAVTGNEFSMTIPHTGAWLNFAPAVGEAIIKDNLFKNTRPLETRSPTELLILAEAAEPRRNKNAPLPSPPLRIIEGNIIQGFPLALHVRASTPPENPARILIAANTLDGALRFEGRRTDVRLAIENNKNLATMQPLKHEIIERIPEPLPPPSPTPEDEAAAASEKVEIN
ncbi:hypothetical protein Ga0100231_016750 [Opitutaceae bacterium TAV4]|nr:hypothetical protein Ga0100231_016750 [Opitutaceae bacterium TAV4]RRK02136.1 hypothetical protein Ga0100230_002735 [Opitutaceae bacterium TAV3]